MRLQSGIQFEKIQRRNRSPEANMMLKNFLLLCILAGLLSVCYSCGRGNGGRGGNGGNSDGNGNGGNGGNGGNAGKRSVIMTTEQPAFSLNFQTFDVNGDGVITRAEFLDLQPGHEELFDSADTDGNGELTCEEFTSEVSLFDGEAIC